MNTQLRMTFQELECTPALESRIHEHVTRLEEFHPPILGCHVIIEPSAPARDENLPLDVTIDLKVPGCEISVHRAPLENDADIFVTLRDAFDAAKRLLRDHERACGCNATEHGLGSLNRARSTFCRSMRPLSG